MEITSSPERFMCFKQLRKQTKNCIATSHHQYLQTLSEKLKVDPKKFWSFRAIKSKTFVKHAHVSDTASRIIVGDKNWELDVNWINNYNN